MLDQLWRDAERCYRDAGGHNNPENPADPYMTVLGYFISLRELGGARRILEEEVQNTVKSYGSRKRVGEARGLGLVGGLELVADKSSKRSFDAKAGVAPRAVAYAEEDGLIVRSLAGDVVSLCPPLIISEAEIDELFDRLTRALDRTLDWARREQHVR